jgi:hypothetical protein
MNINFGLTGTVSVGKSTILNAILCNYLGETKLKRTTYVPFKFTNTEEEQPMSCEEIKNKIIEINQNYGEDIETTEFKLNFINKENLHNCSIVDFPGLNDPHEENDKMENVLFDKLVNLDYLIYIIDSNNSLNNKYERNLLERLFDNIKNCETLTNIIILFNKYDIEDEEIDEIIDEAIEFINQISQKYGIDKPLYYKISGRKLMIKNAITNTNDQTIIPENIRLKVYSEYFGKHTGKKMIKYSDGDLIRILNEIEFTKSENNFLKKIGETINDKTFYSKKFENTVKKISECFNKNINKSIDEYFISIAYYLKVNKNLTDDDKRKLIIKIFDFYYDNNKTEFTEDKNFVMNIFYFIKEIIGLNKCFDDKNKWLFHYFEKTTEKFSQIENVSKTLLIELIEFVEQCEYPKFIEHLLDFIIKYYLQDNKKFLSINGKRVLDFLVKNFSTIKKDEELNILFDIFIFQKIIKNDIIMLAQISTLYKYGHKIYINYVAYKHDNIPEYTNNDSLLGMKFNYFNSKTDEEYEDICNTYELQIIKNLNNKISYKEDIFKNFDDYLIDYYPNDILSLYNFYRV